MDAGGTSFPFACQLLHFRKVWDQALCLFPSFSFDIFQKSFLSCLLHLDVVAFCLSLTEAECLVKKGTYEFLFVCILRKEIYTHQKILTGRCILMSDGIGLPPLQWDEIHLPSSCRREWKLHRGGAKPHWDMTST